MSDTRPAAAQFLYTRLEADQSARGRAGFQTVGYTRAALSDDDLRELERRLGCGPSAQGPDGAKFVVFPLSGDRLVLARATPLDDVDGAGRTGLFLAHALIVHADDLAGGELLAWREASCWLSGLAEALALAAETGGDLPPILLPAPPATDAGAALAAWPPAARGELALLANRAGQAAEAQATVVFVGEPEAVRQAIAAALSTVPRRERRHCSFDTDFEDGNLAHLWYWAVGMASRPASPLLTVVDVAARTIESPQPLRAATAYEVWLLDALRDGHPGDAIETIAPLCRWLAGEDVPGFDPRAGDVTETVRLLGLEPALADARLRQSCVAVLGEALTDVVFGPYRQALRGDGLAQAVVAGPAPQALADELLRQYAAANYRARPAAELEGLSSFLAAHPNPALKLLMAGWNGSWKTLARQLDALNAAEFEWAVKVLVGAKIATIERLVGTRRGRDLITLRSRQGPWRFDELAAVVGALCESGQHAVLTELLPALGLLRPREKARLLDRLGDDQAVPASVRHALEPEPEAERQGGWMDWLLGRRRP